jgi:hypothetical protein
LHEQKTEIAVSYFARKRLYIALIFCGLLAVAFPVKQAFGGRTEASPIAKSMLELCKSQDIDVSLGAMLLSVDIYDNEELEKYIRSKLDDADEKWVTCIKLYTISKYTLEEDDAKMFIDSFPADYENFWKLIDFECSVTRYPGSNILSHLIYYAGNEKLSVHKMALQKATAAIKLADGWVADFLDGVLLQP